MSGNDTTNKAPDSISGYVEFSIKSVEGNFKMNKEIKKKWVDALRSGDYKQTRGHLKTKNQHGEYHCCLGVLTDLYCKETGEDWKVVSRGESILPNEVVIWANTEVSDPPVDGAKLSIHNDGTHHLVGRKNFSEIADLIEKHL